MRNADFVKTAVVHIFAQQKFMNGACRIACEKKAIDWQYPKGTKGVTFKQG